MGFGPSEKFVKNEYGADTLITVRNAMPMTFAAGSGTLKACVPVARNTSTGFWAAWDPAGANGLDVISGYITQEHTLHASNETISAVMLSGDIYYPQLEVMRAAGDIAGTANELKAAMAATRTKQIYPIGLNDFA
jgi:hypothetical protein